MGRTPGLALPPLPKGLLPPGSPGFLPADVALEWEGPGRGPWPFGKRAGIPGQTRVRETHRGAASRAGR